MVMVGHLLYPAIDPERPASLSPEAISLLRRELGFDGVVITDDLGMAGASGGRTTGWAAVEAIKAGADLLIVVGPYQDQIEAYHAVLGAVEAGEIPRGRVEESLRRLMEVKNSYPLYATNSR